MIRHLDLIQTLEHPWTLAVDADNAGKDRNWALTPPADAMPAVVPGQIEATLGEFAGGVVWYWHRFDLGEPLDGQRDYLLKFGHTGYYAQFWLNGCYLGDFTGYGMFFEWEVTGKLRQNGNLLAVRLVNPAGDDVIDGIMNPYYHIGRTRGIVYPVRLFSLPRLRVAEVRIIADSHTGDVTVRAWIRNTGKAAAAEIQISIANRAGELVGFLEEKKEIISGTVAADYRLPLSRPALWDLQDPYLYTLHVVIAAAESGSRHQHSERFGFREFKVADNGFFYLNGRRIYLKGALLANIMDVPGCDRISEMSIFRQKILALKRMGLNTVRFLACSAYPEILDFCDAIGMMVYNEHAVSWILRERDDLEEQFARHILNVVQQARNHASVVIWGLINETHCLRQHQAAVASLGPIRELDETRLVLLSSGRWDMDPATGSLSNPGCREWQCLWGMDGCSMDEIRTTFHDVNMGVLSHRLGDIHIYPRIPFNAEAMAFMRTFAHTGKPAFLSETGICAMQAQRMRRLYEQEHVPAYLPAVRKAYQDFDALDADWEKYGFQDVFAFQQDINHASYVLNNQYKWKMFDMIRSNPKYIGYSMTGDGYLSPFMDEVLPLGDETVSAGFAALRWCLFINPTHAFVAKPFTVEVVLASEDILEPGEYPVHLRIVADRNNAGNAGCVWEKRLNLSIPAAKDGELLPLAFPVFKASIALDVPEGAYQLCAYLERGGAPIGRNETFYLSREPGIDAHNPEIAALGLDSGTLGFLEHSGLRCKPYQPGMAPGLILAGGIPDDDDLWDRLYKDIAAGSRIIFLVPEALVQITDERPHAFKEYPVRRLPFNPQGTFALTDNWHYHQDVLVKKHRYLAGMQQCGLAEYDYYDQTWPQKVFIGQPAPDESVSLAVNFHFGSPVEILGQIKYVTGVTLGRYRYGSGAFVLNTFDLVNQLGRCPAAGKLLMNMIEAEL